MDVAVLLNFTSKLTFEVTNPLMSVITVGEDLLLYDSVSVEPFPVESALYEQHVERLAFRMRNMLEARSLSVKDKDERIRLIVTLDLVGGAFYDVGTKRSFPAQRVRRFKEMLRSVFEEGNPLLKRFDYVFVFVSDKSADEPLADFYRLLGYDGYSGGSGVGWLSEDDWKLNDVKEEVLRELGSPDERWLLTDEGVSGVYGRFAERLTEVVERVSSRLADAGLSAAFRDLVGERLGGIATIGDFSGFDYDGFMGCCVSELLGLCGSVFRDDCCFFMLSLDGTGARGRCKSDVFVASLIGFLVTLDEERYDRFLKAGASGGARLFVRDGVDADDIDGDGLLRLEGIISDCLPGLEMNRWRLNMRVEHCLTFARRVQDGGITDSHCEINDKLSRERVELFEAFKRVRRVPFFFGKRIGDWSWYRSVVKSAQSIYDFERVNDRPLYDLPSRITDKELESKEKVCSYAELENEMRILSKEGAGLKRFMDLSGYLQRRREVLEDFGKGIGLLEQELVKLGYFACLLWLGVFMVFGVSLTYAYHFLWYGGEESPWLVGVCVLALGVLFMLSAVIGQWMVRSRIKRVYGQMDGAYGKLQEDLKGYLDDIALNAKLQAEADVRRKNLDEMKRRMDAFYEHNKEVDVWVAFYRRMFQKLSIYISALNLPERGDRNGEWRIEGDMLEGAFPRLPEGVLREFGDTRVSFTSGLPVIDGVMSFVRSFRFVERQ